MRRTRTPPEGCGLSRETVRSWGAAGQRVVARAFTIAKITIAKLPIAKATIADTCRASVPRAVAPRAAVSASLTSMIAVAAVMGLGMAAAAPAYAQDPNVPVDPLLDKKNAEPSTFSAQPGGMFGKVNTKIDSSMPMKLNGDQLIYDSSGSRVIARGNVEIFYNDYILTADEVIYDQAAGTLTAQGNVTLKEPQGNVVRADRYTLTDDFRDGFVQSLSVVSRDQTRISADRAYRREGNVTEFRNGKFTPCKTDGTSPPLWCISAKRVIHDQSAATITYEDATFDIFGQPVLYLPFFQHADPSVKRKSGFLMPEYGSSTNLGFIFGTPYYFALDPSYDFTFTPTYMSKQGVLWQGEWRQRLANGQYSVRVAGIDQDVDDLPATSNAALNRDDYDGWRGSIESRGKFSLSSWWSAGWDVTYESDDEFRRFYKLDPALVIDRVNEVYLIGQSDRNWFSARLYHFGGLGFDSTNQSESMALPIIDHNYILSDPVLGGELSISTNVLNFSRSDGATDRLTGVERDQNITRLVTEVKWRRKLTDQVGITYTPFANLRGDVYQYENYLDPSTVTINPALNPNHPLYVTGGTLVDDETTVRGLATGGITVAYPWIANSPSAAHILEPIGQIVTRQSSLKQDRLPNEDARSLVFDDGNLFEVTRFSGYDRTEIGTRANVGLQYTFQSHNGGYARFLAGQSFHLTGRNAYSDPGRDDDGRFVFSPNSGLENSRSDYVLGAYVAPTDAFRFIAQTRFDEDDLTLRRADIGARVDLGVLYGNLNYAYTAFDPETSGANTEQEEIQALVRLKLTDNWSVGGAMRFDIDDGSLLSDSFQVAYSDECFVLTATYSELYYNSGTLDDDRTLMLRFELKHIGEFAYKTDALDFAFGGEQRTN